MTPDAQTVAGAALGILEDARPDILALLESADALEFADIDSRVTTLHGQVEEVRLTAGDDEPMLAGLFVADRYINLIAAYCHTWRLIFDCQFANSWLVLQDAMDAMRLIKRLSTIDVSYFEGQLLEIETAYPYNLFFSVGMRVEHFECSICGVDIDSRVCPHRRGKLYHGEMAYGIAREIAELDHVSMVTHPEDKRCVVQYDDDGPQFRIVRHLRDLLASHTLVPSAFARLEWSKELRPNPDYVQLGRNEPCFCGSGRKFKKCCVDRKHVEGNHVEVLAEHRDRSNAASNRPLQTDAALRRG